MIDKLLNALFWIGLYAFAALMLGGALYAAHLITLGWRW